MKLNAILKLKGVQGVDEYIKNNDFWFSQISDDKLLDFVKKYLAYPFVPRENAFKILDYMDMISDGVLPSKDYGKLIYDSTYFKTMPKEYAVDFMKAWLVSSGDVKIINNLIKYITKKEDLEEIMQFYIGEDISQEVADKLIELRDFSLILDSRRYVLNRYLDKLIPENFTIEEIKDEVIRYVKGAKSVDSITGTIDFILEYSDKKKVIDLLIDILKEVKVINRFWSELYLNQIVFLATNFDMNDYDRIAKKIEETEDEDLLMNWVLHTSCPYNYYLVDRLMKSNKNRLLLVTAEDKNYISYMINNMEDKEQQEFIKYVILRSNMIGIELTDLVVSICFSEGIISKSFDKEMAYNLIINGSKYTYYFLNKYSLLDFNLEERRIILKKWRLLGLGDYCTIYGSYLISGDKNMLPSYENIEENKEMLRSLRNAKFKNVK